MTGFGLTGINKTQETQLIVYGNVGSGLLVQTAASHVRAI
jgi:hypothetical protein